MSGHRDRRLLIVEEDDDVRSQLRAAADADPRLGVVVDVATSDNAVATVKAGEVFDALILGHGRDSGLERVRELRAALPSATIVLHTSDDLGVFALALLAGADDVLAKGERPELVVDAASPSSEPVEALHGVNVIDLRDDDHAPTLIDLRDQVADDGHPFLGYAFGPPVDPFMALCGCGWRSEPVADPVDARAAYAQHVRDHWDEEPTASRIGDEARRRSTP